MLREEPLDHYAPVFEALGVHERDVFSVRVERPSDKRRWAASDRIIAADLGPTRVFVKLFSSDGPEHEAVIGFDGQIVFPR